MSGIACDRIAGPPCGAGGGGIPATTFATINARSTVRSFWRCNGEAASLGDSGPGGQSLVTIGATPGFQAETPMALEPTTFAIEFLRSSNESISLQNLADYAAATGTILFFFKTSSQTGNGVITAQSLNALGLHVFVDGTNDRITVQISDGAAGPANFLQSQFTPPASPIDGDWHLCAIRQPADEGGPNWFLDGVFYAADSDEVVQDLTGTATNDFWFSSTQVGDFPADDTYIGAIATSSTTFNGRVFNVVWDSALWTDAELTAYWELALSQGLNA